MPIQPNTEREEIENPKTGRKLIILKSVKSEKSLSGITHTRILLQCFCGKEFEARKDSVKSFRTKSCGCTQYEKRDWTRCIKGHLLDGDNLRISKSNKRVCRTCEKLRQQSDKSKATKRKYGKDKKDRIKDLYLKRAFNISIEEYNKLFENQNGCCAICNKHQTEFKKSFAVDHCHKTIKVRGLLCSKCNIGIGQFNDNEELLRKAIEYIKNTKDGNRI